MKTVEIVLLIIFGLLGGLSIGYPMGWEHGREHEGRLRNVADLFKPNTGCEKEKAE